MKWHEQFETYARKVWSRWAGEATVRVEEPPFVPFDLSPLGTEARAALPAGSATAPERPPATLAELGVPAELAHDLEVAFRAMGATAGDRVIGFRFCTLDDSGHPIRLDDAA